jgi:hypothetical protein
VQYPGGGAWVDSYGTDGYGTLVGKKSLHTGKVINYVPHDFSYYSLAKYKKKGVNTSKTAGMRLIEYQEDDRVSHNQASRNGRNGNDRNGNSVNGNSDPSRTARLSRRGAPNAPRLSRRDMPHVPRPPRVVKLTPVRKASRSGERSDRREAQARQQQEQESRHRRSVGTCDNDTIHLFGK